MKNESLEVLTSPIGKIETRLDAIRGMAERILHNVDYKLAPQEAHNLAWASMAIHLKWDCWQYGYTTPRALHAAVNTLAEVVMALQV